MPFFVLFLKNRSTLVCVSIVNFEKINAGWASAFTVIQPVTQVPTVLLKFCIQFSFFSYCFEIIFARPFFLNAFIFSGKYRTQLYDDSRNDYMPASPGIGMHVEVLDPEKKVILSKFYASEGRFTFTSHTPGEHHICLYTNSTRWSLFAGGRLVSKFCWFY